MAESHREKGVSKHKKGGWKMDTGQTEIYPVKCIFILSFAEGADLIGTDPFLN